MKKLIPFLLFIAVVFFAASCAKTQKDNGENQEPGAATATEAVADTTAPETTVAYSAEEIAETYLADFALWSQDEYINMAAAEHHYQFLDLDFDGVPELVVSVGDGMRGDSHNNYFRIDPDSRKVIALEAAEEDAGTGRINSVQGISLVGNTAAGRKEYRGKYSPFSRLQSSVITQAIALANGKVSDRSLYGETNETDAETGNTTTRYYRYDGGAEPVELTKEEYDKLAQEDLAACTDLHLTFTAIDGEAFDAKSTDEKKAELLAALRSFTYDGFVPGYTDNLAPEEKTTVQAEENVTVPTEGTDTVFLVPTEEDFVALGTDFDQHESFINTLAPTFLAPKRISATAVSDREMQADFHSDALDSATLNDYLFDCSWSLLYEYYFGEPETVSYYEDKEHNPFPDLPDASYYLYSEEKVLWIAENVLNMRQPFSRNDFLKEGLSGYLDGYYYVCCGAFEIDSGVWARIIDKEPLDGNRYRITVDYLLDAYDMRCNVEGKGTLVVALKDVGGQRVWSLYSYEADIAIDYSHNLNGQ